MAKFWSESELRETRVLTVWEWCFGWRQGVVCGWSCAAGVDSVQLEDDKKTHGRKAATVCPCSMEQKENMYQWQTISVGVRHFFDILYIVREEEKLVFDNIIVL